VTLAFVGDQSFASTAIAIARSLDTLAWLLPVAALICFIVAIARAPLRRTAPAAVGRTLLWAALGLGVLMLAGGWVVRRVDRDDLTGAVVRAAWNVELRPMWWSIGVLALVGLAVWLACDSTVPAKLQRAAGRVRNAVLRPPAHPVGVVVRAIVAAVVGIAAIVDPLGLIEPLIGARWHRTGGGRRDRVVCAVARCA